MLRTARVSWGIAGLGAIMLFACGDDSGGSGSAGSGATTTDSNGATGNPFTTGPVQPDMGLMPPAACEASCMKESECTQRSFEGCLGECEASHGMFAGEAAPCLTDFEAMLTCAGALDCMQYAEFEAEQGMYPCQTEKEAFTASCIGMPPTTCDAYCVLVTMCTEQTPSECSAGCTQTFEFFEVLGQGCIDAQTALFDCVGMLPSCVEYDAFEMGAGDFPCKPEFDVAEDMCAM